MGSVLPEAGGCREFQAKRLGYKAGDREPGGGGGVLGKNCGCDRSQLVVQFGRVARGLG